MTFTINERQRPSDAIYWTFEKDGEIFDADFDSQEEAQQWADEAFCQECEECGEYSNGDTESEEIVLVQYRYNDDGERDIIGRVDSTVDFEFYHGDFAEHNTIGR